MGANGAGKSTLIKILLGLVQPTEGTARVLGLDSTRDGLTAREQIGYMPEHDCLPTEVSASTFLANMAQLSGLPPREAHSRAADTLRYVGLDEERYRAIGGYSTGMKQRVKFAQALVHDPRLLFLDEPTNGLDPSGRERMLDLIRRTGRGTGLCIIMSTHLLSDVEQICDQVVVLDGGRLLHAGLLSSFAGAEGSVSVTVPPEHAHTLATELTRRGVAAEAAHDRVTVASADDRTFDLIRDATVDLSVPMLRLVRRRASLADLFRDEVAGHEFTMDGTGRPRPTPTERVS